MSNLPKSDSGTLGLRISPPAFLLGLFAASFQILLLREFSSHFYGNELTFGFVLAAWLFWGGVGSLRASRTPGDRATFAALFEVVLLATPVGFAALRFSRFLLGTLPGESTSLWPVLGFALALTAAMNYPLGRMFVAAARLAGDVARAYFWESAGAAVGGFITYLGLIPYLANWRAVAVLGSAAAVGAAFLVPARRAVFRTFCALALYASMFAFDGASQKAVWKPFDLIASEDSLYAKIQVIRTAEQITFYDNGLRVSSSLDRASAEDAVHFALLQNPGARRVLAIGGATAGVLAEALKYPQTEIDYVDLDPSLVRLAETFLPASEVAAFRDRRVHIHFADGRFFLERATVRYDAVLLDLPEPATALLNRFYTREFFRAVRGKLAPGGVLSFRVPAAENYVSPDLQRFLSAMRTTLKDAFPEVAVVPGDSAVFLASTRALDVSAAYLLGSLERLGISTRFVAPSLLPARLHPLRVQAFLRMLEAGPAASNTDDHPVSYYFSAVLWSAQFKGVDAATLRFLAGLPSFWLPGVTLFALAGILVFAMLRPGRKARPAVPMAMMGLTTMALEIGAIIWFQTRYGNIYRQVALLLTLFMAGLAAGSSFAMRRRRIRPSQLVILQSALALLVLAVIAGAGPRPPGFVPFVFLFVLGYLGGNFFVVANRLLFKDKNQAGRGYGWDLIGSFLAAVSLSTVFIPLVGLTAVFRVLLIFNVAGLVFLGTMRIPGFGRRKRDSKNEKEGP